VHETWISGYVIGCGFGKGLSLDAVVQYYRITHGIHGSMYGWGLKSTYIYRCSDSSLNSERMCLFSKDFIHRVSAYELIVTSSRSKNGSLCEVKHDLTYSTHGEFNLSCIIHTSNTTGR